MLGLHDINQFKVDCTAKSNSKKKKKKKKKRRSAPHPPSFCPSITTFASSLLTCGEPRGWRGERLLKALRRFIRVSAAGAECAEREAETGRTEGKAEASPEWRPGIRKVDASRRAWLRALVVGTHGRMQNPH